MSLSIQGINLIGQIKISDYIPPVAVTDSFVTDYQSTFLGTVATNDTENYGTYSLVSGVSNGTLVFNADGSFEYTPANGYEGIDSFTYQLSNTDGISTTTVNISVTIPILPLSQTVTGTADGNLLGYDVDAYGTNWIAGEPYYDSATQVNVGRTLGGVSTVDTNEDARWGTSVSIGAGGRIIGGPGHRLYYFPDGLARAVLSTGGGYRNVYPYDEPNRVNGMRYGEAVSISGNKIVVGAPYTNRTYVYHINNTNITLAHTLNQAVGNFGYKVACDNNYVAVSAGNYWVYVYDANTGAPYANYAVSGGSYFGESIDIDSGYLVIGYRGAPNGGEVRVYDLATRALVYTIYNPEPSAGGFGTAVSISPTHIMVGCTGHYNPDDANSRGAAYIYERATGKLVYKMYNPVSDNNCGYGKSVGIGTGVAVVGAPSSLSGGIRPGQVHVYTLS